LLVVELGVMLTVKTESTCVVLFIDAPVVITVCFTCNTFPPTPEAKEPDNILDMGI
jgi:hypothetical protein